MFDIHKAFLTLMSFPTEAVLHSNHTLCFWAVVFFSAMFHSFSAAALVLSGTFFSFLASCRLRPGPIPQYAGPLDVFLGRSIRASTQTPHLKANNNVTIAEYKGDVVMAYRKAESHFASPNAKIIVAKASPKDLQHWEEVWTYTTGDDDLRETLLFEFKDTLFLYFVCLEPFKQGFTPRRSQWTSTTDLKVWTKPVSVGQVSEIIWDVKVHAVSGADPKAYKASYVGNHYAQDAELTVLFETSGDGMNWEPVGKTSGVYTGGVCEVTMEFTPSGDLVAVGRNEDGDHTGFGSMFFFAPRDNLGEWVPMKVSIPYRFDSPRMHLMEGELVLFARYARESYELVPKWFPFWFQRVGNLVSYSLLPKSGAVYRVSPPNEKGVFPKEPIELIRCFEGTYGDTGFFSLAKMAEGEWIVANYSSTCHSHAPWIYGQVSDTDVFICRCFTRAG